MKGNTILLILILLSLCGCLVLSHTNFQQIQMLRQENTNLWIKIDSVQQICNKRPQRQTAAPETKQTSTGSALLDYLIQFGEESAKEAAKKKAEQKVVVSSKYRIEDRYVLYNVEEPDFIGNQIGEVVLNISVNYSGDVKSAKTQSITGITDEEVIEACKKAALRTKFNYNADDGYEARQEGTITYIFTAK